MAGLKKGKGKGRGKEERRVTFAPESGERWLIVAEPVTAGARPRSDRSAATAWTEDFARAPPRESSPDLMVTAGMKKVKGKGRGKDERRVTFAPESGERRVSATSQKRNMNAADSSEKLEIHENGTSRKRIREIDADGSKKGNTAGPGAYKSAPGNLKSTKDSHSSNHVSSKFVPLAGIPGHKTRNLTDMAVRVNVKVEEGEVMKFGQKFIRVFKYGERLRIPQSFSQYLQNQRTGSVILRGQSGNKWLVELASDTEGFFFRRGWKEFGIDHSIGEGNLLLFCYDGYGQFSVNIFNGMCVEKPSALHAKPSKDFKEESDEDDNGVAPQEENNGTTKKPTGEIYADGSTLKKCSNASVKGKQKMPESLVGTCNVSATRQKRNKNAADPSESLEVAGACRSARTSIKSNDAVMKVQRQHAIVSQRLPVSEGQKKYALQRAEIFTSKYPSTLQVIKAASAYNSFFMVIPSEFVREHLPHTSKKLTLWDPQATPWQVDYVYCSHRSAGAFSRGWSQFSIGNNLEKFDVCVFELIAEDTIKVHIYRAQLLIAQYQHQEELSAAIPN
ncbi:B3 domain-containing protein Os11g0197600 isoform X1 [Aegilops tauschii subsp. strangulata]